MKDKIILSIIIPTYNRSKYLEKCLNSVLSHEGDYYEIIVSDNASPDSTQELMKQYTNNPRVRYYRNDINLGAMKNIYKATAYAQGEYILWLSDDDYLLPSALSKVISAINLHPEAAYIYSPVVAVDDRNSEVFYRRDDFKENKLINPSLKSLPKIMSSAWVFSRQILKRELIDWEIWNQNKNNSYFMIILVGHIFLSHPAYFIADDLVHHIWFNTIFWEEFGANGLDIKLRTAKDYAQCINIVLSESKSKSQLSKFYLISAWERTALLNLLRSKEVTGSLQLVGTAKTINLIFSTFQYSLTSIFSVMEYYFLHRNMNYLKHLVKHCIRRLKK